MNPHRASLTIALLNVDVKLMLRLCGCRMSAPKYPVGRPAALNRLRLLVYDIDVADKTAQTERSTHKEKTDKTTLTRLPKPDQHQRRILDAFKIAFPEKL
jgi:hypothetical protein